MEGKGMHPKQVRENGNIREGPLHRLTLLRELVNDCAEGLESCEASGREVLIDVEVDGYRYQLVRIPVRSEGMCPSLSPREREIARLVAQGYPNKTIAAVLDLSTWTIGTHLRRIFAKLRVGSRAAMVARLVEDGVLETFPRGHRNRMTENPHTHGS